MKNVIYAGIFFVSEAVEAAVEQKGGVTLEKAIALPHVTLVFRPRVAETALFGRQRN